MNPTCQMTVGRLAGISPDKRVVTIIASTSDIDGNGNKILQDGWVLDRFKANPVICLQHDASGWSETNGLPIANAIPSSIRVENDKLMMDVQFPPEGKYAISDYVFSMLGDGMLKGVSVGWAQLQYKDVNEEGPNGETLSYRLHIQSELQEVSFVTIPANDKAMVLMAAKLNRDVAAMNQKAEKLEAELLKSHTQTIGDTVKVNVRVLDLPEFEKFKADFDKLSAYFKQKQPANRESTKVMARFFGIRGEKQPDDEVAAWKRMAELLEEPAPLTDEEKAKGEEAIKEAVEEVIEEKKSESTEIPIAKDEPIVTTEGTTEEIKEAPSSAPVQEAPEPAPKASVQISLAALQALPRLVVEMAKAASEEALRTGLPVKDVIDGIPDAIGHKLMASLVSHSLS